jgi:hypothetical protein
MLYALRHWLMITARIAPHGKRLLGTANVFDVRVSQPLSMAGGRGIVLDALSGIG